MDKIAKAGSEGRGKRRPPDMAVDTRRQLAISLSPGSAWGFTALGPFAFAVGIVIVKNLIPGYTFDGQLVALGWFALIWSPVFLIVGLRRLQGLRVPILILSPAGFHDTRLTYSSIPWSALNGMAEWQRGPYRKLALQLSDAPEVQSQIRPRRVYRGMSARIAGAEGILCDLHSLDIDEDRVVAAFRSYNAAYGKPFGANNASIVPAGRNVMPA